MTKISPLGGMPINEAIFDARLLGAGLQPFETWRTWGAVLKAAFGLPLTEAELATFRSVAGERRFAVGACAVGVCSVPAALAMDLMTEASQRLPSTAC
jgi:hypothetical protein